MALQEVSGAMNALRYQCLLVDANLKDNGEMTCNGNVMFQQDNALVHKVGALGPCIVYYFRHAQQWTGFLPIILR